MFPSFPSTSQKAVSGGGLEISGQRTPKEIREKILLKLHICNLVLPVRSVR